MTLAYPSDESPRIAPVNELLALLSRYAPLARARFKPDFPKDGLTLGLTPSELRKCAELADEGLKTAVQLAHRWHPLLHRRAQGSQVIRLIGQVLTLVGGASFLISLAEQHPQLRYVLGGLTCLGSVAALFSKSVGQALWGERSAGEALVTLVETRVLGEQLLNNLRAWRSAGLDLEYGEELIGQANELSRRLLEIGVKSGAFDGEEEQLR